MSVGAWFATTGLLAVALVLIGAPDLPYARAALPLALVLLVLGATYLAAGGAGALRVVGAMGRRTRLAYVSYRAQLLSLLAWGALTLVLLVAAGRHVLDLLVGDGDGTAIVAILVLGFTTWPVLWKSWEVTALGVRTEQWEGTFESMVPMPHAVQALPLGYLASRIPFTILFHMAILATLVAAMPPGIVLLGSGQTLLDFAAVLALAIACMWGMGLLFGGLAILYKRLGPADLVVRTLFIFLAGVFVPLHLLPQWAQWVARGLPMTYAYELLQDVALDGAAIADRPVPLLVLLAFSLAAVAGGNAVYRIYVDKARRQGAIQGY